MGGFFGAVSHEDVTLDIFFGVDYHSHLGTRRGGMLIHDAQDGFQRQIHSIENTPFRTKFEKDLTDFHGCSGIGCISDTDPQPLLVRSHLGLYAITTVGIINNSEELIQRYFSDHGHQFMAMSSGKVNATELAAALINQKDDLVSGILHAQEEIRGSLTLLILTSQGEIIAARDQVGKLPVLIGKKRGLTVFPSNPSPIISWATPTPMSWAPGDRPHHRQRYRDPLPCWQGDEDLRLPVDLLRLSQL